MQKVSENKSFSENFDKIERNKPFQNENKIREYENKISLLTQEIERLAMIVREKDQNLQEKMRSG